MEWIESFLSDALSLLNDSGSFLMPEERKLARLAVLSKATRVKGIETAHSREVREAFRRELDGFTAAQGVSPDHGTGREVNLHYGRILELTSALELTSGDYASTEIARALREEAGALCDAYSRWCDHMLDVWRGCIDRMGHLPVDGQIFPKRYVSQTGRPAERTVG